MDSPAFNSIQLDPLDDNDPYFLSFLAEGGSSKFDDLDQGDEIHGAAEGDESQVVKKRKIDNEGAAVVPSLSASSSSSSSSHSIAIAQVQKNADIVLHNAHLSAKSCQFVTTRGQVRGDTLTSMERVANVVADKVIQTASSSSNSSGITHFSSASCSSIDPPIKVESAEQLSRTPQDLELATLPRRLYDAIGDLDMERLRQLLDTYLDENCTYVTTNTDKPLVGRDSIYQFLFKVTERVPDAIRTVRHSRVVVMDEMGNKVLKFKVFSTGTYLKCKVASDDIHLSMKGIVSNLEESTIGKKEISDIKRFFASSADIIGSFTYIAYGASCWYLNEHGKIRSIDHYSTFVSLKPVKDVGP